MPELVSALPTVLRIEDVARAYSRVFTRRFGTQSAKQVACYVAQSALECGHWKHCYQNDIGNVKASADYAGKYYMLECDEIVSPSQAEKAKTLGPCQVHVLENGLYRVVVTPPHPWSWFRAYDSLDDAVEDIAELFSRRYMAAVLAAATGDPAAYAHALRVGGYYTAPEAAYTKGVGQLYHEVLPIVEKCLEDDSHEIDDALRARLAALVTTDLLAQVRASSDASDRFYRQSKTLEPALS